MFLFFVVMATLFLLVSASFGAPIARRRFRAAKCFDYRCSFELSAAESGETLEAHRLDLGSIELENFARVPASEGATRFEFTFSANPASYVTFLDTIKKLPGINSLNVRRLRNNVRHLSRGRRGAAAAVHHGYRPIRPRLRKSG